jgi:trans-aconitate 2-methyltransferase
MKWNAAAYDIVSTVQERWGISVIAGLPLKGDETVLDAGCGSGRVTAHLLDRLPHGYLFGVDKSQAMIDQASAKLAAYSDRAQFICADLCEVALPKKVDVVFSNAVFHWIPDHERLFKHLGSLMRSGGIFHTQCGGKGNLARAKGIADQVRELPEYESYFRTWEYPTNYPDAEETAERMVAAGFTKVYTDLVEAPTDFDSRDSFSAFVENVVSLPYLSRLPGEQMKQAFLTAYVDKIAETFSGRYWLDYVRLNIKAIKS